MTTERNASDLVTTRCEVHSRILRGPNRRHALLALATAAAPGAAWAQSTFPQRAITLIVPFAPGGIADITARTVAEVMSRNLGQSFVIDNRPSAGSIVASSAVAKAPPDGYTLLLMSNSNALSAGLFKKLPYDVVKDFAPVGVLGVFDLGLFVPAASRFASLRELVAFAKSQPGKLTIGTIAVGSTQHLAAELFKTRAGIDAVTVPYKGTPAVLTALRAGEIDLAFEIVGPVVPQVTAKAVRALAVSSERPNPAMPEVPTVAEAGVAGYSVASWNALAAPAGTPADVIDKLNAAARQALADPTVARKLQDLGVRAQPGSPAQLQTLLGNEIRHWGEVIRAAKIEPE